MGRTEFYTLRPGVPDGLVVTLIKFVVDFFYEPGYRSMVLRQDASERFARFMDRSIPLDVDDFARRLGEDRDFLVEVLDYVLGALHPANWENQNMVDALRLHLTESRSAYTVGTDGEGRWEIQDVQPAELTGVAEQAAAKNSRAGEHLRRAWSELYGRKPNYNAACAEAVAAIESAAKPVVSPSNAKTTLGTLVRDMRAKPSKWITDSESETAVEAVIAMMDLVWTGHFRHGDETQPIEVTKAGAEMVVHLASVLVHWFESGRIRLV